MALSEAAYALEEHPCELHRQGYEETRNMNLLKRWVDGKTIPVAVRTEMLNHFSKQEPDKIWGPVVRALKENDRNFLEVK